jgi:hypothetical protein
MLFMNEGEIDQAKERFKNHPVLGRATRILEAFKDKVNASSDGWCYWKAPLQAAKKLIEFIQSHNNFGPRALADEPPAPSEALLKKALTPIKAFCTKHKWEFPDATVHPEKVTASLTVKEATHIMGPQGEIICTVHPIKDGRGFRLDFDHEPVSVETVKDQSTGRETRFMRGLIRSVSVELE